MDANFELLPGAVATVAASSKREILDILARFFAATYGLDEGVVREGLEEREKLGSTGFGRGVAIPHARMEGMEKPVAALLRLDAPVAFDAADGMPVDLVIGLLSPSNAGVTHLHALAAISRMVRDDATYDRLIAAENSESLFATLTDVMANTRATGPGHGPDRDAA